MFVHRGRPPEVPAMSVKPMLPTWQLGEGAVGVDNSSSSVLSESDSNISIKKLQIDIAVSKRSSDASKGTQDSASARVLLPSSAW